MGMLMLRIRSSDSQLWSNSKSNKISRSRFSLRWEFQIWRQWTCWTKQMLSREVSWIETGRKTQSEPNRGQRKMVENDWIRSIQYEWSNTSSVHILVTSRTILHKATTLRSHRYRQKCRILVLFYLNCVFSLNVMAHNACFVRKRITSWQTHWKKKIRCEFGVEEDSI